MTWFIDRRLNGKNKSAVNRQRFLRRYKAQIKQSISEAINKRSVTDIERRIRLDPDGRYQRADVSSGSRRPAQPRPPGQRPFCAKRPH